MRFLVPLFVFLSVAGFHTALSASLESPEKEEKSPPYDGMTDLLKIDLMEFEAAQKTKAAQINVTEAQNEEDSRYLEAAQDGSVEDRVESEDESKAEGAGNSDASAHGGETESESESSEDTDGRQRREHHETVTVTASSLDENSQDSSKEQDLLE
ncbi:uncharacterized protein ACNS7B_014850 isoform 1-T1 [Menidia menidia]|uniref:(Atlantic silverside) hypothetical protein n=1 Tax=Menidia menidia TaxID=238744 RepID=A0A8S4AGJ7_9TELE|nr:unnamed protein product [Menidia menidia]